MAHFKSVFDRILPIVRYMFIGIWLSCLSLTDAYFSVYVLTAFAAFYLLLTGRVSFPVQRKASAGLLLLSGLFSAAVLLANYPLFTVLGDPALIGRSTSLMVNLINAVLTMSGGCFVFYPILKFCFNTFPLQGRYSIQWPRLTPVFLFLSVFGIQLIHLLFVEYPGNLTEDTFTQISEMITGSYSNFNTFWHTMLLRGVLTAGYAVFKDGNAAVALFCVLQAALLAGAFTYCLTTMRLLGAPRALITASWLGYLLLPYNMALSITIWKDVLFAASTLLMISSWFRILKRAGERQLWNYLVFILGSLLYFLSRTNGWLIYAVTLFIVAIPLRKNPRFLGTMAILAAVGWFLLNPALSLLHVAEGDKAESLSLPIQQVSRVIAEGCDISQADQELLSKVVDMEEVPDLYVNWLSDPMKVELRSKNYDYFLQHYADYRNLWIRLGLEHPWEYLKAWVDQTKGYWNAGYDYALYSETITDNPYGIEKSGGISPVSSLFRLYFGLSRHLIFFEPLHSIGLHIWIMILCFLLNIVKRREEWVLSIPLLLLVIGLWFGTPVYACFRYVYPLFVCFPLMITAALYSENNKV